MEGTLTRIVDVLTRTNNALIGMSSPSDPKPSQLLNEYIALLKTLEEESVSMRDVMVPVELIKAIDEQTHPDTLLLQKLKDWKAREQQYDLKVNTLRSMADRL